MPCLCCPPLDLDTLPERLRFLRRPSQSPKNPEVLILDDSEDDSSTHLPTPPPTSNKRRKLNPAQTQQLSVTSAEEDMIRAQPSSALTILLQSGEILDIPARDGDVSRLFMRVVAYFDTSRNAEESGLSAPTTISQAQQDEADRA